MTDPIRVGSLKRYTEGKSILLLRLPLLAVAGQIALTTSLLCAQTLPLPVVPPPPPPTTTQSGTVSVVTEVVSSPPPWEYRIGLAASYDSNVDFDVGAPSDVSLGPRGEFARLFRGQKGQISLRGLARGRIYADRSDRNRVDAEVGVDGTRRLSTNATLRAAATGSLGHTDSSPLLIEQGVSLPLSRTLGLQASALLEQRLGVRNLLSIESRAYVTEFDDPLLVTSRSFRLSTAIGRQLSQYNRLGLQYSLERVRSDASYQSHYMAFQWSHVLGRRSAVLVEGGASRTGNAATSGLSSEWNFYGGATFTREVGRNNILLFARREVLPSFGVGGLRLSDRFGLTANIRMGRTWGLNLGGTHVRQSQTEEVEGEQGSSDEGTLTLYKSVGRRASVAGEARYQHRGAEPTRPSVNSFHGGIIISFSGPRFTGR